MTRYHHQRNNSQPFANYTFQSKCHWDKNVQTESISYGCSADRMYPIINLDVIEEATILWKKELEVLAQNSSIPRFIPAITEDDETLDEKDSSGYETWEIEEEQENEDEQEMSVVGSPSNYSFYFDDSFSTETKYNHNKSTSVKRLSSRIFLWKFRSHQSKDKGIQN